MIKCSNALPGWEGEGATGVGKDVLVSLGKFGNSKLAIVIQNYDGDFYQVGNVSFEALLTPGNTTQITLYEFSGRPSYFKNGLTYKWVAYQI